MMIGIMIDTDIAEVKNIRDIVIGRLDPSLPMFAITAVELDIGRMNVTCLKSLSKLYIYLIIFNQHFYYFRKPYQSGSHNSGSHYSSNSLDHKPKKDYGDKKEKADPGPSLEKKSEALKEQEKIKEDPSKPKDIKPE